MNKETFKLKDESTSKKEQRTAEFPLIQKAVARTVQEYGEALRKLALDE